MTDSPRNVEQALEFARNEADKATQDWTGYCQRFVRTAYGLPSLYGSAYAQWLGADDDDRHAGGRPEDAPLGAALCWKGSGPYGHIAIAARGNTIWSTDAPFAGVVGQVARSWPAEKWGQKYLGYLTSVNGYDLRLHEAKPPKPQESERYRAIGKAIDRLEQALATARKIGDKKDARAIRSQLIELRELDDLVRKP